jgi:hypothetical protein
MQLEFLQWDLEVMLHFQTFYPVLNNNNIKK